MCGIVYRHNFDGSPVNNDILQQFDAQRRRGTQGFGLFDGQEMNMVREANEDKILKWLVKYDSNLILFHHRFPTSTINNKQTAHPFSTKDYFGDNQYILVHNGVISNDDELHDKHKEMGIKYGSKLHDKTFNDSEALLWDLALTLEGKQDKLTAQGSIAFICLKIVKGKLNKLYFGRNTNPLKMHRDKQGIWLSSEGKGEDIQSDQLYTFNYELNRLTHHYFKIPSYSYSLNNYYSSAYYDDDDRPYKTYKSYTFGKMLPVGQVIDYDYNGDPIYENIQNTYAQNTCNDFESQILDELNNSAVRSVTEDEVEMLAVEYLFKADGNFDSAYWHMEADYDSLFDLDQDINSFDSLRQQYLLEEAMEKISTDPEYVSPKSVSSRWSQLWAH